MPYRLTHEKMQLIVKNWQLLADKFNGKFRNILATSPTWVDRHHNEFRCFELHIPLAGENLIFVTSENHHFKLDYQFKHHIQFEVQIYPEDFVEKISKILGMKEVEIGNREFDNKYIIKSNRPELLIKLLDKTIQDYMLKFNLYSFQLNVEEESKLMILPFIREQNFEEMESFILFSGHIIQRLKEINKGGN